MAARNRVAEQLGIKQDWWWPGDVGTDVHAVMKNDPLTDRASVPDKVSISAPRLLDRKLEIGVEDRYEEIAADGTDLGGTKFSHVTLVPLNGRWVIEDVAFTVRQYGRTKSTTLTEILGQSTRRLQLARRGRAKSEGLSAK